MKPVMIIVAAIALVGCQTTTEQIQLSTYAPVIDVEGHGYDVDIYNSDLESCRRLGEKVQTAYAEQRRKEREAATQQAIAGALLGAVVGHAVGSNNDYHTGRSATAGALYGGAIAGAAGAESVDYSRTIAKFGPTAVVDRCMADRGYKIISIEGFGGG